MKRRERRLLAATCAMAMTVLGAVPASAQSSGEKPTASEIGVTAKEIHIAVIADVDNPFAPGLFKGARDGVIGAAKYINSKAGGGGLAGRRLVVDFIDSHLNANDTRNGVIAACQQDFAMVGNFFVFLNNVDDEVNCKDHAGVAIGLPDLASATAGLAQSCSPVAFPVGPAQLVCSTKDDPVQTYNGSQYTAKYFLKQHKGDLHGAFIYGNDTRDAARASNAIINTNIHAGIKSDQTTGVSGRAPQSAYTPIINKMKTDGSNYGFNVSASNSAILLRREAQLQGLPDTIVWDCTIACYDQSVKDQADVMDGQYVTMTFLPFEEASTNKTLATFLKYVGKDNVNGFAVYGWTATLAFKQAVDAIVKKHGVNGLTRANLLGTGMDALTSFNAGGMIGNVNMRDRIPTPCAALVQLRKGEFVRVAPKKQGTFDCSPTNRVKIKANLNG